MQFNIIFLRACGFYTECPIESMLEVWAAKKEVAVEACRQTSLLCIQVELLVIMGNSHAENHAHRTAK